MSHVYLNYQGADRDSLYDILVKELVSHIHDNHLCIGRSNFHISRNFTNNSLHEKIKRIGFLTTEQEDSEESFQIWNQFNPYFQPFLNVSYYSEKSNKHFHFPLDNNYVKEMPAFFYRIWMRIAIDSQNEEEYNTKFQEAILFYRRHKTLQTQSILPSNRIIGSL